MIDSLAVKADEGNDKCGSASAAGEPGDFFGAKLQDGAEDGETNP